jgi:chromosome segregation ATPase
MTDQPAYVTRGEFEDRMRVLESEMEGEKAVTRHVLQHARLNGDDLATMKAQLAHLADDMVLVKAALNTHGTRLNVLTQDVREIRMELGQIHSEMGQVRSEMGQMHSEMGDIRTKLDALDVLAQDMAAIRAAVAPRDAPGNNPPDPR